MKKQIVKSYSEYSIADIVKNIEYHSKIYGMPIKTVSLSTFMRGCSVNREAIVVFESEEEE